MKTFQQLKNSTVVCMALLLAACGTTPVQVEQPNLLSHVNPYIGTGDHGHVFLGANVPYGFVQLGPTQYSQGWDWCSGYHITDSTIIGFGHQHLSGTGIGDLGDIAFMPVIGEVKTTRGTLPDQKSGIYSYFTHDKEHVEPGYYAVYLERFGIEAQLTATKRVGFHKYLFPESDDARILIDLEHGIGWDSPLEGNLVQENDSVVSGYRHSKGWAKDQIVYFTAVFSKPMKGFVVSEGTEKKDGNAITAARVYGQAVFDVKPDEEVLVKVALSPISVENAKMNMKAELPGWDFEQTKREAGAAWNEALNRIYIETKDNRAKEIFYTALYHTFFFPCVFNDVNGDYRGADGKVYNDPSYTNLTVFSLWDTYRGASPLMTLINPEQCHNVAMSLLNIYKQQGKLPVWHLVGNETDCMVGNPGVVVLADLLLKGFPMDHELAFEAMKNSAMRDERGMNWLKEYGYIPYDKETNFETVAKGLEFALADWCIAQVAKKLNKSEDYEYFMKRSMSYKEYFDTQTQFMRAKSSDGKFREPFSPFRALHERDDYTEGNGWQYTWLVPHDVYGLIDLFGGEEAFVNKLDSLFVVEGDLGGHANDVTGLIGMYAHGNEPSHHVLYLYPYAGQPWKGAELIRNVLDTLYDDQPAGLSGNEDAGQMSAWYVLSAIGLYQVEPAGGKFVFGSPIIDKAVLNVGNGKTFTIVAHNNSAVNKYIQDVTLNGQAYDKTFITYADIVNGGTLEFTMASTPSETYGMTKDSKLKHIE